MSGTWKTVDPGQASLADAKVVTIKTDGTFDPMTDYGAVVGRHLEGPAWDEWFASGGVLILATEAGAGELRLLANSWGPSAERGVRHGLQRLAADRQIVALRRLP